MNSRIFTDDKEHLPLLSDVGRAWQGLDRSSSPEMSVRLRELFEHLNTRFGFAPTDEGKTASSIVRFDAPLRISRADD